MNRFFATTALSLLCAAGVAAGADPAVTIGSTAPSERRTFAFESPGVVAEVLVKDGDRVRKGQTLARQEGRMDQQELEVRRIDAESVVEIEAARKEHELRKIQYERKKTAPEGFSPTEIEEARITMELAELKIAEAEQKKKQAQAVYMRQLVKVELGELVSKIDGIVEKVNVDAGEMADPQKPEGAISVVNNDPLWVELPLLATWQVARLAVGQELQVRYKIDPPDTWKPAKIIFISPVADARAGTQLVRLELPNSENRSSGLDVEVKLPPELTVDPAAKTAANN